MANTGDPAEPACETGPPEHCLIGNSINHSSCDWYLFFEPQSLSSSESDLQRRDVPFDTEYVNRVIKPPATLRVFQRGEVNAVMDKINALRRLDNTVVLARLLAEIQSPPSDRPPVVEQQRYHFVPSPVFRGEIISRMNTRLPMPTWTRFWPKRSGVRSWRWKKDK